MKIILTAIGLLVTQDVVPSPDGFRKELTYIKFDDVIAIKTSSFMRDRGGEVKFYMKNNISDSLGWKPIIIPCYTDEDYQKLFDAMYNKR